MGRTRSAAVTLGLALLVAGCGTEVAPGASPTDRQGSSAPSTAPSPGDLDVSSMVGTWSVTGPGVAAAQKVTLSPGEVTIWQVCGRARASWRASTSGLFAAAVDSWSGDCSDKPDVPWLERASGWRPDGTALRLIDGAERELARLEPAAAPTDPAFVGIWMPDQASLTDEVRAALNAAPSVGAGIERATRAMLIGSWTAVPPSSAPEGGPDAEWPKAGFTLDEDGTWSGTDGCNGGSGRWSADGASRIIATSGPQTQMGCNNIEAPTWLGGAWLAGFEADGTLVLFDHTGAVLGRLTRG